MATLASRLIDVVGAIRDKFNTITPRLLPAGGTTGQVLQKTSGTDYATGWVTTTPYETDIGNGTDTSFVITHNKGTKAVRVVVFANASPYARVIPDVEYTSNNTVTLIFGSAYTPTTNQYHVVVG